jgi:hypothetical protein
VRVFLCPKKGASEGFRGKGERRRGEEEGQRLPLILHVLLLEKVARVFFSESCRELLGRTIHSICGRFQTICAKARPSNLSSR